MTSHDPYQILDRKRLGETLTREEIDAVVAGTVDGSWSEAQIAAFLMAVATRGLDAEETAALVAAMVDSGERWNLADEVPNLVDKHSTGGVGDKVSLILAPLLAATGIPVAMLTGRALGHTGGTADKLETIPGLTLDLDREGMLGALAETGVAIGLATPGIAPADRIFYALRDRTGTVQSLPLVTSSIVSKKVALGPAAVVYDVKTGPGAIFPDPEDGRVLAQALVEATRQSDVAAGSLMTDMSQPLGEWSGHAAEVGEAWEALAGEGAEDLLQVTLALSLEAARLVGVEIDESELRDALSSGRVLEKFIAWAGHQGADAGWLTDPDFALGREEFRLSADRSGVLAGVDLRRFGRLLQSKAFAGGKLNPGVAVRRLRRLGDEVEAGEAIALAYLDDDDPAWLGELRECWSVADEADVPPLIHAGR